MWSRSHSYFFMDKAQEQTRSGFQFYFWHCNHALLHIMNELPIMVAFCVRGNACIIQLQYGRSETQKDQKLLCISGASKETHSPHMHSWSTIYKWLKRAFGQMLTLESNTFVMCFHPLISVIYILFLTVLCIFPQDCLVLKNPLEQSSEWQQLELVGW